MKERLQKILSSMGVCSRRKAEEYIKEGAVKVNGITANLGDSADVERDEITMHGQRIGLREQSVTIMLNKPRGYVTTLSDENGRKTVLDLIADIPQRIYPVGRLDLYSEGLLLMTNDGELANKLTHPSHQIYKTYLVHVGYGEQKPDKPADRLLSAPMTLDGQKLAPARCRFVTETEGGCILTVSIRQGKNRQIRRMCAQCGLTVRSLKRVAVGNLQLGELKTGSWRALTEDELSYLKSL
ncbi:MAG: rRNA pseudouridine synthase [Ruminococcaceae bacterium]|nr:rRNA pseudouridine synthase [Oscillospiraceae bacterium]